jgi:signal recognition particle receptor subunit beta
VARIDSERGQLVLSVVYDGPARSGKTTSLRSLARSLAAKVFAGAEEEGRTLYFEWVDYVGGLFEGMPIRCQIVTVPGQTVFERRRRRLLETADAVVFVADSSPLRLVENQRSYALLQEIAARQDVVDIGIVVQANKRDLPDALDLDRLRSALGGHSAVAMTEATAGQGDGVRETFVLAVRLALDRVRALAAQGKLESGPPEHEEASELLAAMMQTEHDSGHATLSMQTAPAVLPARDASGAPRPPDASIPPGLVWPPVRGRAIIHEAARHAITVQRDSAGHWRGVIAGGGWHIASPEEASFPELETGRLALIEWARWHASVEGHISSDRAIVLAPDFEGSWRLWQIVRETPTLLDMCRDALQGESREAAVALLDIIDLKRQAVEVLAGTGHLHHPELGQITISARGVPLFAGPVPYRGVGFSSASDPQLPLAEDEVLGFVRTEMAREPERVPGLLAGLESAAMSSGRVDLARILRLGLLNT